MKLEKTGIAGTLESSDIQVKIEAGFEPGIEIVLNSPVKKQFGSQIEKVVREVIERHDIESAVVELKDSGALDCTIRARVECAIARALGEGVKTLDWEELSKWAD